jgi:ABC-type multidrug transport system permease subunit
MTEQHEDFNSIQQDLPAQLSAKELQAKRFQSKSYNQNNKKKAPLRLQVSKPPRNSVKIKPVVIPVHFTWALVLTIFCFFIIGPCWALYKTFKLRRMIQQQESDAAKRLSHKISSVLVISTILGIFVWVAILFCTLGLVLSAKIIESGAAL